MTYNKPEIIASAVAIKAIAGDGHKPLDIHQDWAPPDPYNSTVGAYQSDE